VLQCVAVCRSMLHTLHVANKALLASAAFMLQCFAVYCSVLQCVAVCCSVLQCVAVCCGVLHYVAVWCCWCSATSIHVAVCHNVLQCVAVCCSVLHCVAVCCIICILLTWRYLLQRHRVAVCCSMLQSVAMCCTYVADSLLLVSFASMTSML